MLKDYIGDYILGPGRVLTFSLEQSQPMIQLSGQPKVPAFAESQTSFFLKEPVARFEFFRDKTDRMTHLIFHQDDKDVRASRKK
jgi:hypothetical protein